MAHRTAHPGSLPVKSVRGREEVSLSIGVLLQLLCLPWLSPQMGGSCRCRGIVVLRSASFPVLAVLAGTAHQSFRSNLSLYGQRNFCANKRSCQLGKYFLILVDNSRCSGYYRIKHFGFFQGAPLFEVKDSLRKGRAFCFTSNIYVRTPVGLSAHAPLSGLQITGAITRALMALRHCTAR